MRKEARYMGSVDIVVCTGYGGFVNIKTRDVLFIRNYQMDGTSSNVVVCLEIPKSRLKIQDIELYDDFFVNISLRDFEKLFVIV
jgi:hypothetical protein